MMSKEAMKLALEALEYIEHNYMSLPAPAEKAITALREALAEQPAQQQEPVAWRWKHGDGCWQFEDVQPRSPTAQPLYTSPPAQRKPLTDEEIDRALDAAKVPELPGGYESVELEIARAIEAAIRARGNT